MGHGQEESIERCAAKRRAALVLRVFKGAASVADAARQHGLTVAEVEGVAGPVSLWWHVSGEHYLEALTQPSWPKASWQTMGLTGLA